MNDRMSRSNAASAATRTGRAVTPRIIAAGGDAAACGMVAIG